MLEIFRTLDSDGNGMISREELLAGLSQISQKLGKNLEVKDAN
jgi:Ca2+-binding EF-hand superfamily protein